MRVCGCTAVIKLTERLVRSKCYAAGFTAVSTAQAGFRPQCGSACSTTEHCSVAKSNGYEHQQAPRKITANSCNPRHRYRDRIGAEGGIDHSLHELPTLQLFVCIQHSSFSTQQKRKRTEQRTTRARYLAQAGGAHVTPQQ